MKILYDGWPLTYSEDDPAAIHLLTLLAAHPAEFPAGVALPGPAFHALPGGVDVLTSPTPDTPAGRLRWEQRLLPALARRSGASRIHTTRIGLALFGATPGVISPAGFTTSDERAAGFAARLGAALGAGGAARARAWLWPADLPIDETLAGSSLTPGLPLAAQQILPPVVHRVFHPSDSLDVLPLDDELARFSLPETFILVHGPAHATDITHVLDVWSWAAGSIGIDYPLVWVGIKEAAQEALAGKLAEYELAGTVCSLPPVSLPALAELYRRCSAVLHPGGISPWAAPARLALACARPLAAYESPAAAALVGPAAYLAAPGRAPAEGARALGAALLTIIVEEGLAESLAQAARARADAWNLDAFRAALQKIYRTIEK